MQFIAIWFKLFDHVGSTPTFFKPRIVTINVLRRVETCLYAQWIWGRCEVLPRIGGRRVSHAEMHIFVVCCVVANLTPLSGFRLTFPLSINGEGEIKVRSLRLRLAS